MRPLAAVSRPAVVLSALVLAACEAPAARLEGQERWRTDFTKHTVPLEEIVSGGPPKDGIPAIDRPRFVSVDEADEWIDDREPVAVVQEGGETKAYPLQIMIRHEIVNDEVGGRPVSVTYCPLCNTTLAFDRRLDGRLLDFGTTGRLRHSDLVMYDRQTESWWQQATGEGIVGEYAGRQLEFVPAPVLSWAVVEEEHPDARVLSRDTGFPEMRRYYGQNPYAGYDTRSGPIARFFRGRRDDRLPPMERVVALDGEEGSVAVPFERLREVRVAHVEVGGEARVVFWAPGTASAVDRSAIASGRDVGSGVAFRPFADGRRLTFEPWEDGRFRDRETGSTWTVAGRAVAGPLAGSALPAAPHGNHFWFAWVAFRPGTEVWGG